MPGSFGRDAVGQGLAEGNKRPKKLQRYAEGEKQVYYADDNNRSLDDLVREQRHGGGRHMDDNLAENISRKSKFRSALSGKISRVEVTHIQATRLCQRMKTFPSTSHIPCRRVYT